MSISKGTSSPPQFLRIHHSILSCIYGLPRCIQ